MSNESLTRFERLKEYLEADPENASLLTDAAHAALEASELPEAVELFDRLDRIEPLAGANANAAGIAHMRNGEQAKAQQWFEKAHSEAPDDASLQFNLAWSKALAGDFEDAAVHLDGELVGALPQAAMLDLQIAHELGQFDEAATKMTTHLEQFPDYAPLQAAASVLAMDIDQPELARASAEKGGGHPDALTTLATLELGDQNLDQAEQLFTDALSVRSENPRAEIGLGLVMLARGDAADAAANLDKGANQFETHLGTWIASGWAHFLAGDQVAARERFEKAADLDQTFGEAHGSLAVLDMLDGKSDEAERQAKIAMRLDPGGFSGALASILIAQSNDDPKRAEAILKSALAQPIHPDGTTLVQALAKATASPAQ